MSKWYVLNNIKLSIDSNQDDLEKEIKRQIGSFLEYKIKGKSIDARKKDNILYVYSVYIKSDNNLDLPEKIEDDELEKLKNQKITNYNGKRPVVVGSGPSGMFAALMLSYWGLKPIILERGKKAQEREKDVYDFFNGKPLNVESNVQFGEGGAGTFSDGKLTTNTHNKRIQLVLEELIKHGAKKEIEYINKPHIGTDELIKIVVNIRKTIESLGGEYRFSNRFETYKQENNKLKSIIVTDLEKNVEYEIETDYMILATGHSARDTFENLSKTNLYMEKKPFAVGVRIEHLQDQISKTQFGKDYIKLPPAEYKLNAKAENGRGVYTFCMCPGGVVVPSSSEENMLVVNGMSYSKRDKENANSAVLVDVKVDDLDDDILSGVRFQQDLEQKAFKLGGSNYKAPVQLVVDFVNNKETTQLKRVKPSYHIGYKLTNINGLFPKFIEDALKDGIQKFNKKFPNFYNDEAIITAVESRSSSPIRIKRDETLNSNIQGIYPSGEGAGFAGGIMSAAVDGIKCAEKIFEKIFSVRSKL